MLTAYMNLKMCIDYGLPWKPKTLVDKVQVSISAVIQISVYTTGNAFPKVLQNNGSNAGIVCNYPMLIIQCLSEHQPGHPVTTAMLRDMLKETLCICQ